jgi:centrosomal protein CEP112
MVPRTGLTILPLFLTVQILIRDCQVIRETKENQITELKKICEQSTESLNNDWEKKVSSESQAQDCAHLRETC